MHFWVFWVSISVQLITRSIHAVIKACHGPWCLRVERNVPGEGESSPRSIVLQRSL